MFGRTPLIVLTLAVLAAVSIAQEASTTSDPPPGVLHPQGDAPASIRMPPSSDRSPACGMNVSYERGQLRIVAQGCRLVDVLRQVEKRSGAIIDVAPGLAQDAVFTDLGPGPASDVLASLLYGSSLDYIILGSRSNANQITRVILTASKSVRPSGDLTSVSGPSLPAQSEEPSVYGVGFAADADDAAVGPSDPAPVSRDSAVAAQQSEDGKKTPGQILNELQKEQIKKLDEDAAQPKP